MTNLRPDCRFLHRAVVGIVECSLGPDGYMDRVRFECRRFPPQSSFWGTSYPRAVCPCGEYQPIPVPPTTTAESGQ